MPQDVTIRDIDSTRNANVVENVNASTNELAVSLRGHVCADNTSTTALNADAVFTGAWQDTLDYGTVVIGINADQNSATDGLKVQWSSDASTVHDTDVFTISANSGKVFSFCPARRYVRLKYTNGGTNQTSFNLETTLRRVFCKQSSHRIQDSIVTEDDAQLMKSVLTGEDQDNAGTFVNVKTTTDGTLTISNNSSGLSIAEGNVTGVTFIHKFGQAPDFDIGDGFVTVWDGANDAGLDAMTYTYSSTADIDSLTSSDNSDTQNIEIQGLDTNFDLVTQTVTLTGQTRAALSTSLIRVFRMINRGSTDLAGQCYCYVDSAITAGVPDDKTKVRAIINDGNNQTLMSIYTVPNGKTAYMRDWYASLSKKKTAISSIKLIARPQGEVFQLKHITDISTTGSSHIQHNYQEPEVFAAKTDIEMRADTSVDVNGVSAGFDIVLVDD